MALRFNSGTKEGEIDIASDPDPREGRGHMLKFGGSGTGGRVKTDYQFQFNGPNQLNFAFPRLAQGTGVLNGTTYTITSAALDIIFYYSPEKRTTHTEVVIKTRAAATSTNVIAINLTGWENFDFLRIDRFTDGTPFSRVQESTGRWMLIAADGRYIYEEFKGGYQVDHKNHKSHRNSPCYMVITRPKLIAADLTESWGTVDYANGVLTYTFDANFLATAPLPIRWV